MTRENSQTRQENTEPSTLSAYMRIGAQQTRKTEEDYCAYDREHALCTCALGSAYLGWNEYINPHTGNSQIEAMFTALGIDYSDEVTHPDVEDTRGIMDMIIYLNDQLHHSREAIADWLESIGY